MATESTHDATVLLHNASSGDALAAQRLAPVIYDELRRIASAMFRGQPANHTLQPTALVHEAFLKMFDQTRIGWNDKTHFLATAASEVFFGLR